jgi:hypothetical protein
MLKLRSIGISDYSVLEAKQRIGRIPLRHRAHAGRLVVGRHRPPECRPPDGLSQRPRHGQGGVQGGLGSSEGRDHAGAARGGLQSHEQHLRPLPAVGHCENGREHIEARRAVRELMRESRATLSTWQETAPAGEAGAARLGMGVRAELIPRSAK